MFSPVRCMYRAALCLKGSLAHGFRDRGVRVNGRNDLVQRHLFGDGQRTLSNEIGGSGTNDVHTEDLTVLLSGNNLHNALTAIEDQRLAVGGHGELADLIVDALRLALLLRQADGSGLRLDVDAGGIRALIVDRRDPHDVLRRDLAHRRRGVRKLGVTEHAVADGVDAGNAGLHLLVDEDAATVIIELTSLQIKGRRVGAAADSDQHLLRLKGDRLAGLVLADDLCADRRGLYALHRALKMKLHAHLLHMSDADLGQVAVEHGEHMVHGLDHSDLRTERGIGARQFETDHTTADDDHALRQLFQAERAGRIDAVGIFLEAGDWRLSVDRAGRNDDRVGGHLFACTICFLHRELAGSREPRLAVDLRDLVHLEQARDAARELLGYLIFVRNDLLEIDLYAVNFNTDILALILDILDQLRAVKQALGGDAADVQAGTAKVLTLNDGHLCAELSKPDRRNIAAVFQAET